MWGEAKQIQITNEYRIPDMMQREDKQSLLSSKSISGTSAEFVGGSSNCGMSPQSTSFRYWIPSSKEKSVSKLPNRCCGNDIEDAMVLSLGERKSFKATPRKKTADLGILKTITKLKDVEVIRQGTKLMKTISIPTVIVVIRQKLKSSTLYYIILEPESGKHFGEIICMMLSSPRSNAKSCQTAELLPLKAGVLTPMLLNKRYNSVFNEGCTFKVKAIMQGRRIDPYKRKWKHYSINKNEIHELLRGLLYLDAKAVPKWMVKGLIPLRRAAVVSRTLAEDMFREQNSLTSPPVPKLSCLLPDLRFRGIAAKGGSSFAKWFDALPPNIRIDRDFTCDKKTKLRKDKFKNAHELNVYLSLSEIL